MRSGPPESTRLRRRESRARARASRLVGWRPWKKRHGSARETSIGCRCAGKTGAKSEGGRPKIRPEPASQGSDFEEHLCRWRHVTPNPAPWRQLVPVAATPVKSEVWEADWGQLWAIPLQTRANFAPSPAGVGSRSVGQVVSLAHPAGPGSRSVCRKGELGPFGAAALASGGVCRGGAGPDAAPRRPSARVWVWAHSRGGNEAGAGAFPSRCGLAAHAGRRRWHSALLALLPQRARAGLGGGGLLSWANPPLFTRPTRGGKRPNDADLRHRGIAVPGL